MSRRKLASSEEARRVAQGAVVEGAPTPIAGSLSARVPNRSNEIARITPASRNRMSVSRGPGLFRRDSQIPLSSSTIRQIALQTSRRLFAKQQFRSADGSFGSDPAVTALQNW
jgi:hypothetical protein